MDFLSRHSGQVSEDSPSGDLHRAFLLALLMGLSASCVGKGSPDSDECFTGGILVLTPSGERPISTLQPGDPVMEWDIEAEVLVSSTVARVIRGSARQLLEIEGVDRSIRFLTASHPFYELSRRKWIKAGDLVPWDILVSVVANGGRRPWVVSNINRIERVEPAEIFNIETSGPNHTFVAEGVVAHNKTSIGSIDEDGDGWFLDPDGDRVDCDDSDPLIYPGATEVCDDSVDNDCDGDTDLEDVFDCCPDTTSDADGDGWKVGCEDGYSHDCDDTNPTVNPSAEEICDDGIDNDCDEAIDMEDATCRFGRVASGNYRRR